MRRWTEKEESREAERRRRERKEDEMRWTAKETWKVETVQTRPY